MTLYFATGLQAGIARVVVLTKVWRSDKAPAELRYAEVTFQSWLTEPEPEYEKETLRVAWIDDAVMVGLPILSLQASISWQLEVNRGVVQETEPDLSKQAGLPLMGSAHQPQPKEALAPQSLQVLSTEQTVWQ
jgi:hypothetical protein